MDNDNVILLSDDEDETVANFVTTNIISHDSMVRNDIVTKCFLNHIFCHFDTLMYMDFLGVGPRKKYNVS